MLTDESLIGESKHVNNVIFDVGEAKLKLSSRTASLEGSAFVVTGVYTNVRREADPSQKQLGMTVFIGGACGAFMLQDPRQC